MITTHTVSKIKAFLPIPIGLALQRLAASPLYRRLASGAFWVMVGALASRGLNMGAMIVLARFIGKIEFGEIGVIQSSILMFQTLAGFGLGWAATRYIATYRICDPDKTGRIIAFVNWAAFATGSLICIVFFLSADWMAHHPLNAPHLAGPLRTSSLSLLFASMAGTQNGILSGFEAFQRRAHINLFSGIINFGVIVAGGYYYQVEGAVWGIVAGQIVQWLLTYAIMLSEAAKRGITLAWRECWQEREILWKFGFPAILGGMFFQVATWISTVFLVNQPDGYAQMGYYNAANQWFSALIFLPMVLGQASIPVFSEYYGAGNAEKVKRIYKASLRFNSAVVLIIVCLGSVLSPWIMGLYGAEFRAGWLTLALTLLSAGIAAIQAPAAQIIRSANFMWVYFLMDGSWAILFIVGSYTLIAWGSDGLATARIIAYVAYATWSIRFSYVLMDRLENPVSLVEKA